MLTKYRVLDGKVFPNDTPAAQIMVYVDPTAEEKAELHVTYGIDEHTLASTLDPDEVSRIEIDADHMLLIWKRPRNASTVEALFFDVSSVGMLVTKESLVLISREDLQLSNMPDIPSPEAYPFLGVLMGMQRDTIGHYLAHLKAIKMMARDLQDKVSGSINNSHLLQMFNLSECLIYYINAISANGVILGRLRHFADREHFPEEFLASLDDLIIDNNQCGRQAEIYSEVFSGLMDARGNLINNNMNVLLKNLTIINVVFLPLNLIASVGGMSEFSMMTSGLDWRISYSLFCLGMLVIGWLTAIVLQRHFEKAPQKFAARRDRQNRKGR